MEMGFVSGELRLGGLIVARLSSLSLDFITQERWTMGAVLTWEYRPRMGAAPDQREHYQLLIPLESGDLFARVSAPTGTSSGCGDGESVSLKGESQLWTRTAARTEQVAAT